MIMIKKAILIAILYNSVQKHLPGMVKLGNSVTDDPFCKYHLTRWRFHTDLSVKKISM